MPALGLLFAFAAADTPLAAFILNPQTYSQWERQKINGLVRGNIMDIRD
jgi:hypothetical protein